MKKIIIAVHGLGNKPDRKLLEKWWIEAIKEGLEQIGKPVKIPMFKMIYWADILYSDPLDEKITDKKHPLYFHEKYVRSKGNSHTEAGMTRQKFQSLMEEAMDNIFLNDDYSLNFSGITDKILKKYFSDLHIYYSINGTDLEGKVYRTKDLIRKRIASAIKKYKNYDIFLISHSMGSIIAFDVLKFMLPEIRINTFATIGSPLGLPVVLGKIAAENKIYSKEISMTTPESVKKHWYNFSDPLDNIAFDFRLSDDFNQNSSNIKPVDFIVSNNYEIEGIRNPHKSYGYLRSPRFSEILYSFITENKQSNYRNSIFKYFKSIINAKRGGDEKR